jgi:hypothetical protein
VVHGGRSFAYRAALAALLGLTALLVQPRSAAAESKTWTGATGSWTDADNWQPAGQPQAGDDVIIDSGSAALGVDTGIASLTLSGGTLTGSGTLTVTGTVAWTAGTMSGSGSTVAMAGMDLGGSNKTLDGRTVVLSGGTAAMSGSGSFIGMRNGATFTNQATFELSEDGGLTNNQGFFHGGSGGGSFINHGTLRKLSAGNSGATRFAGIPFDNIGTVEVLAGTLSFSGGYTQTAGVTRLDEATLTSETTLLINGGRLEGVGTVQADVSSVGEIGPGLSAGALGIAGAHTQRSGGRFTVELGGVEPGGQFDQLNVDGAASLAGALDVRLLDGFVPAVGQQFEVMTFASRTGTFVTVTGLELGGGVRLVPIYGATNLVLTAMVVAEEPTPTATPQATVSATSTDVPPPTATPTETPNAVLCIGDCDGDDVVRINELILAVGLALRDESAAGCAAVDENGDDLVTVNELIAAVNRSLVGCTASGF